MRSILAPIAAVATFAGYSATADATVHVNIDLSTQSMHVSSDSGASYDWPISSGKPGHATPRGSFRPQRMFTMVHSAKYDNAPMPHAIFFHGPYAIHGTGAVHALGHPASHGCVRLSPGNAATLFAMVQHEGAQISISGTPAGGDAVASVNPHKAGHRLAMAQRHRFQAQALGYAPRGGTKSLRQWARDPFGDR